MRINNIVIISANQKAFSEHSSIIRRFVLNLNLYMVLFSGGGPAGGQDVAASMLPSEGLPLVSGRVSGHC